MNYYQIGIIGSAVHYGNTKRLCKKIGIALGKFNNVMLISIAVHFIGLFILTLIKTDDKPIIRNWQVQLELTDQEIKEFLPQIKEVLNAFSKLKEAPSNNLEPSFQPIEVKNITREDKIEKCLTQEQTLQNTQYKKDGYFKGPKTF